jgi:oligosaccharide 4-alpha-D-glucosyltransferase
MPYTMNTKPLLSSADRKYFFISLVIFLAFGANAQPTIKGNWTATTYPNQAVLLSWRHNNMQHAEHIGDALIAKPTSKTISFGNTGVKMQAGNGNTISIQPSLHALTVQMAGDITLQITKAFDSGHIRGLQFSMPANAPWFGGGERSLPMNRVGQRIPLYNNAHYGYELNAEELNYSVPFIFTTAGFGLLFDNPSKGYLDFGKTTAGILEAGFSSGDVNVMIIPGKTPEEIIANYALLTGRQPLPPRWALGNFVSRFGYRSQQQVEEVVQQMKADNFPVDALIIDIFWFGDSIKGTLGNLDWINRTKWPNPEKMIGDFRKQQIKPILVTEPFFLQGTKNFEASKPYLATDSTGNPYMLTKFYFGYGGLLDLFKPEARNWFWKFYKTQTDKGISGWWGDLGEPENHPEDLYHDLSSFGIKRKVAANEVHNMYGHMWNKMLYENWRTYYPQKRLFFLNRAGYAGSQRYSVFPWTGDVSRTWNGFRAQLPNLQSMSMSGVPYIHSDAGGFSNVPDNDQELYIRWLQMAGFTPIFRPHGTAFGDLEAGVNNLPSEPVYKDEPYKSIARDLISLRYSLIPYIYTMAWEQAAKGKPIIRPMMYNGVTDTALLQATDQYMFGDVFLVAPVLQPGATTRKLYLPAGNWYNYHTQKWLSGKQWIEEPVTLEKMPLFVKAGSIVPMWIAQKYTTTAEYTPDQPMTLRFYPGNETNNGYVYDDDGENPYAMTNEQAHQLLQWSVKNDKEKKVLTITPTNWPAAFSRRFVIQIPSVLPHLNVPTEDAIITINGKPVSLLTNAANPTWLNLPIICAGKKIEIVFRKK